MSESSDREKQAVAAEDVGTLKAGQDKSPRAAALKRELEAERSKLEAELRPFRDFYEQHVNDPRYLEARAKIREINGKLGPVLNELAALARVGGSKGIAVEPGVMGVEMNKS